MGMSYHMSELVYPNFESHFTLSVLDVMLRMRDAVFQVNVHSKEVLGRVFEVDMVCELNMKTTLRHKL